MHSVIASASACPNDSAPAQSPRFECDELRVQLIDAVHIRLRLHLLNLAQLRFEFAQKLLAQNELFVLLRLRLRYEPFCACICIGIASLCARLLDSSM